MGFLQTIGEGYKIMGQEAKDKIIDNRANIFTGVSVIGTIGTAIASWIGGMKSARAIDAEQDRLQRPLEMKEKAKLCWKNTIVPAGAVIASGASAITSNRIQAGDIARLTTDVVVATKAYNELKKATNEVVTEKQQMAIKDKVAEKDLEKVPQEQIDRLVDPSEFGRSQIFREEFSGIVFCSTVDKVRLLIAELQTKMKEIKPRNKYGYTPRIWGVHYYEWINGIRKLDPSATLLDKETAIYKNYGFNKGYWNLDQDDDDDISVYFAPGMITYHGEERSCLSIIWDQDPSDMNLGDILKSVGND